MTRPNQSIDQTEDNIRIVVADENEPIRDLLTARLEREGYSVEAIGDGRTILQRVSDNPPDLLFLGRYMPYLNGLQILEHVREQFEPTELPIIMMVQRENTSDLAKSLSRGANDCVTKPINFDIILARVRIQLTTVRQHRRIQALLQVDPESGLFNQQFLTERLDEELARLNRYGGKLTVMTISFVSSRGEVDRPLLRTLANTLKSTCRSSDILGRLADNQFGLILTETDPVNSVHVKRRLKQALNEAGLTENLRFSIKALDDRDYEELSATELFGNVPDHESPDELRVNLLPEARPDGPEPAPVEPLPEEEPSEATESEPSIDEEPSADPLPDPDDLPLESVASPEPERRESGQEATRESWFDSLLDVILMKQKKREQDNS